MSKRSVILGACALLSLAACSTSPARDFSADSYAVAAPSAPVQSAPAAQPVPVLDPVAAIQNPGAAAREIVLAQVMNTDLGGQGTLSQDVAAKVTDCAISNASPEQTLQLAKATLDGVTPQDTLLVAELMKNPQTVQCVAAAIA